MEFNCKAILVAVEKKFSQKTGKPYFMALFAQGVNTISLMISEDVYSRTVPGSECVLSLLYNTKYNQFKLVSCDC